MLYNKNRIIKTQLKILPYQQIILLLLKCIEFFVCLMIFPLFISAFVEFCDAINGDNVSLPCHCCLSVALYTFCTGVLENSCNVLFIISLN